MSIQGRVLMQLQLTGLRQGLNAYFHWTYTIRSYRKTYHVPIKGISIKDLPSGLNILPPKLGKLRGRLKTQEDSNRCGIVKRKKKVWKL